MSVYLCAEMCARECVLLCVSVCVRARICVYVRVLASVCLCVFVLIYCVIGPRCYFYIGIWLRYTRASLLLTPYSSLLTGLVTRITL